MTGRPGPVPRRQTVGQGVDRSRKRPNSLVNDASTFQFLERDASLATRHLSWLLFALASPAFAAAPDGGVPAKTAEQEKPVGYLKTSDDKALYALGYSFGKNIQVFDLSKSEM